MNIDPQVIKKVAALARIEVDESEMDSLRTEMSKILTFMEQLNALDTDGVEPLIFMNEEPNQWRTDKVTEEIDRTAALQNAAVHNDAYFLVPKILES